MFQTPVARLHVGAVLSGGLVAKETLLDVVVKDDGEAALVGPAVTGALQHAPGRQCPVPEGPGNHLPGAVDRFPQASFSVAPSAGIALRYTGAGDRQQHNYCYERPFPCT